MDSMALITGVTVRFICIVTSDVVEAELQNMDAATKFSSQCLASNSERGTWG